MRRGEILGEDRTGGRKAGVLFDIRGVLYYVKGDGSRLLMLCVNRDKYEDIAYL